MKKRIRKKLHKGEFQELGFQVEFDYADSDNEVAFNQFWYSFIDAIEQNGLECGGGGHIHHEYFVMRYKGSVSEEQRIAIKKYLEEHSKVSNVMVGELKDAWYGY
jgi:uncharacterized protein YggL (DUF469 family)